MKLEITQKGAHGPDGKEHAVGDVVKIEGDAVPGYLVGKARKIIDGAPKAAITNPANDQVQQVTVDPDRAALMGEACKVIDANRFTKEGVPDVRAINAQLAEGVPEFTAAERDAIWPDLKDAVMAAREAA